MRTPFLIVGLAVAVAAGYGATRFWEAAPVITPAVAQSTDSAPAQPAAPAASVAAPASSGPSITVSAGQKLDAATLGPVIEQYLMDHPEVIAKAVAKLQQRQAANEQAGFEAKLVMLRDQLQNAPLSPVLGNPKGDVTVVEFFDYKCPYCKRVADDVLKLIADDPNVRVVFKEFPILGPDSQIAALAALAADKQGKYSAFHAAAMSHRGPFTKDAVLAIAKDVGLDTDKLQADMADKALMDEIAANQSLAEKLGINGTPAFIVGNQKAPGAITIDEMKKLVIDARQQKS